MRVLVISCVFFFAFSKVYVFYLERNTYSLRRKNKQYEKEIKLLEIEWTYLNQHIRLQALAKELLDWQPVSIQQLKNLPKIKQC